MPLDLPDDEIHGFLRGGDAPGPMLDLVGMMAAHAAAAGIQLGVFDALAAGPRTAAELAPELGADLSALPVLLDALVATGYLTREPAGYANTVLARRWLCADAPSGYGKVFTLWFTFVTELWGDLAGAVRTGSPGADFYSWLGTRPALAARFQGMQDGLARWLAEEVVALAPVADRPGRLLDLGGGLGAFSAAFCRRYPSLAATVVDLPAAVAAADPGELAGRLRWREGDLTAPVPDRDQDVVLLCNVVHGFPPEQARRLVAQAVAALRPGGALLLLETAPRQDTGVAERAFTACFALNLWHTQGGHAYPVDTLAQWVQEAGGTAPWRYDLTRSPTHVLLAATRPAPGAPS